MVRLKTSFWKWNISLIGRPNFLSHYRLENRSAPQKVADYILDILEHHVSRAALDLCDQGQLSIIPETTHWLHLEEPNRLNREIIEFLGHQQ